MGAECRECGWDLPFDGECVVCRLRAENGRLREALENIREVADLNSNPWFRDRAIRALKPKEGE